MSRMIKIPLLLVCIVLIPFALRYDLSTWQMNKAYTLFKQGDLEEALSAWSTAGNRPDAVYNRGVAHVRKGESERAVQEFGEAVKSRDPALRQRGFYNLGTLLLRTGIKAAASDRERARRELVAAAEYLRAALLLNREDPDARYNEAVARKSLAELTNLISPGRQGGKNIPESPPAGSLGDQPLGGKRGTQTDKSGKSEGTPDKEEGQGKSHPVSLMTNDDANRLLNEARGREALHSTTAVSPKPGTMTLPEKDW